MSSQALLDEYLSRLGILQPEPIVDLFADAVDFYVPGSPDLPWPGRRHSRTEIVEFFRRLAENLTIENFRIDYKFFAKNAAVVVGEFISKTLTLRRKLSWPTPAPPPDRGL